MSIKKDGIMVILSSPSGAGKTTLVKLLSKNKNFYISVSHTTRKPRLNEITNKDYYFVNLDKFENLIKNEEFLEYAKKNINVNCISPGFISTAMTDQIDEKFKETIIAKIPSNRLGKPEDIANAVNFLSSDQSDYINGETLHVNGGMYLGWQNYFLNY